MIIGLNYTNANTLDQLNDQMCKVMKEISFLTTGNIDAENIRARSITSDLIVAGSITANEIATNTITASNMNVSQLSAITADLGSITAGSITGITITGGTIRTSSSGYRIEITSDKLVGYNSGGSSSIEIRPDQTNPYIKCGTIYLYDYGPTGQAPKITLGSTATITLSGSTQQHTDISSTGNLYLSGMSIILNNTIDLISTLSGKANSATTLSGYGITDAYTKTQSDTNFAPYSHTQAWSTITGTPTTISGYNITNAATKGIASDGPSTTTTGGSHNHGLTSTHEVYMRNPTTLATYWQTYVSYAGFTVPTATHTHTQN